MLNKEEIFMKVREILSDSIDIDEETISRESLLFKDFGIESVEILEITFRVEQEFGFVMGEGEFWNVTSYIANLGMDDNGMTEESKKMLMDNFAVDKETIDKLGSPFDIYDYITVEDLVNYVENKCK